MINETLTPSASGVRQRLRRTHRSEAGSLAATPCFSTCRTAGSKKPIVAPGSKGLASAVRFDGWKRALPHSPQGVRSQ